MNEYLEQGRGEQHLIGGLYDLAEREWEATVEVEDEYAHILRIYCDGEEIEELQTVDLTDDYTDRELIEDATIDYIRETYFGDQLDDIGNMFLY